MKVGCWKLDSLALDCPITLHLHALLVGSLIGLSVLRSCRLGHFTFRTLGGWQVLMHDCCTKLISSCKFFGEVPSS